MTIIENDCVGCDLPCMDCGLKRVPHLYCDECGEEKKLYSFEKAELCADCLLEKLDVVEGSV